jgi:hypothetical protein
VEDFSQDLEVDLCITHHEEWDEKENPDLFTLGGELPKLAKPSVAASAEASQAENSTNDDDDVQVIANDCTEIEIVVEDEDGGVDTENENGSKKRPAETIQSTAKDEVASSSSKKMRHEI